MLVKVFTACLLVAATVVIHAGGLAALYTSLMKRHAALPTSFWPMTWLLISVALALLLIHAIEIAVWALFFLWAGLLPDAESAFYFSGVTYATVGYGDLVLPQAWRIFGPIEGLTGILMCGLSTGFFFAILVRVFGARFKDNP
jgi:hypothetical protein